MINALYDFLTQTVDRYPKRTAVVVEERRVTYAEISQSSDALAGYLQAIGVKRGDRVVTCLGNTVESIISFWGIQKAGAVVSPIGVDLKQHKLLYILHDSGAKVLITTARHHSEQDDYEESFANFPVEHILLTGDEQNQTSRFSSLNYVFAHSQELQPRRTIDVDLAAIIYTSGSTGEPKGVMLTHRNMIAATESLNAYLGYAEHDVVACALPLSFDYGLYQMIMSFSVGATLVLEKDLIWPAQMLKTIAREQATILPAVPTIIDLLKDSCKLVDCNLSSIRKVTNTGAALNPVHIKSIEKLFPNAAIYSMYGLTECKRCTFLPPEEIHRKPTSVGIAIPNTELWLVDETGNKLGPNRIGQLVVRGSTVMKGYWNKPEQTAQKLKDGPLPGEKVLYTGDYCMMDEDGFLYFKGRIDQVIKIRGIKVSPVEIENYIVSLEHIKEVAVLAVSGAGKEDLLCAFVAGDEAGCIDTQWIKDQCRMHLEAYKRPESVIELKTLPKTPNGKIDKIALQAIEIHAESQPLQDNQKESQKSACISKEIELERKAADAVMDKTSFHTDLTCLSLPLVDRSEHVQLAESQPAESASKQINYQEIRLELSRGCIAAKAWGAEDGIPVLAIHGWLDNANSFDKVAAQLDSVRLVALDLPGHGHSDHRSMGTYYIWDYVYDVLEFADKLGWKRFAMIGHSMGSGIAVLTAGAFPERVTHLALIDGIGPPFTTPAEQAAKHLAKASRHYQMTAHLGIYGFSKNLEPMFSSREEAVQSRMHGMGGTLTREASMLLVERQIQDIAKGYRWRSDPRLTVPSFLQMSEEQVYAFIKAITCPTCLILGDRGLFAQGQRSERLSYFQTLEQHVLAGGHHLHLEDAASDVVELLRKFLR